MSVRPKRNGKRLGIYKPAGMDLSAPFGAYLIDAFVSRVDLERWARETGNEAIGSPLHHLRKCIQGGANAAISERNRIEQSRARREALDDLNNDIGAALKRLQAASRKVALLKKLIAPTDRSIDYIPFIERSISRSIEDMIDFSSHFRLEYEIQNPPNADVIGNKFILNLCSDWKALISDETPISAQSDFVVFLAAAWRDVGFPEPLGRDGQPKPLEDALSETLRR